MIINDGAPVCEHFYSDFVSIIQNQKPNIYGTSYQLHVCDASMTNTYTPDIDNETICTRFLSNVLNQIALYDVAIVLVTNIYGQCVYIIASDD